MAKRFYGVNIKMQTKKQSFIEANINTFAGFILSWAVAYTILPFYGMEQSIVDSVEITLIFTTVSIFRNYFIRRYFNAKIHSK